MKRITNFIIVIITLIVILFLLTGCKSEDEQELLKEKSFAEMEYLENRVLVILKKYLMGDYLDDNNEIQWNLIEEEFSGALKNSSIIAIDLAGLSINNDLVLSLENKINAVSDAIASKTESNFIGSIKDVYKFVPELLDKYYQDKNIIRMKYVKSYLLDSLYFYIVGDKQNSISSIELAEKQYLELINDKSYLEENSYKVNRDYVTIQEMKIAVQNGELKTVIQKYLDTLTF